MDTDVEVGATFGSAFASAVGRHVNEPAVIGDIGDIGGQSLAMSQENLYEPCWDIVMGNVANNDIGGLSSYLFHY